MAFISKKIIVQVKTVISISVVGTFRAVLFTLGIGGFHHHIMVRAFAPVCFGVFGFGLFLWRSLHSSSGNVAVHCFSRG